MHPSIVIALALSMAASVATTRWAMPPLDLMPQERTLTAQQASCAGYLDLHLLLKSAQEARRFLAQHECDDWILRSLPATK